jgi:hypothetical protein
MAEAALDVCKRADIYMTAGTPYHTGVTEEFETNIAAAVGAV